MKILIWFLCIFANALITTILRESGIILGGIPTAVLFGGTMWLARTLCKKWDEHKGRKQKSPNKAEIPSKQDVANASGYDPELRHVPPKKNAESNPTTSNYDTRIGYLPQNKNTVTIPQTHHTIRYCRMCGNKLLSDALFCDKCGTKIFTSSD